MIRKKDEGTNIKTDNSSFKSLEQLKNLGTTLMTKILFRKKLKQPEVRVSLLSFSEESFVFQFTI